LQFQKILYFRKHRWRSCIDFSTRGELKKPGSVGIWLLRARQKGRRKYRDTGYFKPCSK
jgi:hypothetical protein